MTEPKKELSLTSVLAQDEYWISGQLITEMDWKHRANLIPFLRRSAAALQFAAHLAYLDSDLAAEEDPGDGVWNAQVHAEAEFHLEPEDWLEQTPLMRKLVSYEQGRPFPERVLLSGMNKMYEVTTGYKKITLIPGRGVSRRQ